MTNRTDPKTYGAAIALAVLLFVVVPVLFLNAIGWPIVWHAERQAEERNAAMQPPPLDTRALAEITARQQIEAMPPARAAAR